MEFLDNLVLPQSSEHIELLHYMAMLILSLFVPFISIIFGGASLSLYYRKKGLDEGNAVYLKFAKDIIDLLTINKSIGIILGIVPLLTSVLVYVQLLHTANISTISYLVASFFLTTISIILIYTYKYSLSFKNIFESIKNLNSNDPEVEEQIKKFKKGNESLSIKSGRYGIIILFISLWIFVAALTLATYPNDWGNENLLFLLFSWEVLSRFIHFIAAAFALTGGAILFGFFYWDGGKQNIPDDYRDFVRTTSVKLTLTAALFQPVFLLINLFALPGEALSASVFGYSFIALFLLFLAYNYLYAMLKESTIRFSGQVFYVLFFALLALIVKDQLAMSNATKQHSGILIAEFETYLAELKGTSEGVEQLSGLEIYEIRCASCHRFDQRIVGPSYEEVLPKYEGKIDQLVSFILNPVKVDPQFPPMPNPGLRPHEAKAIADFEMIEHMKNVFTQRSAEAGENGEQLFNLICAACHSFENDMVGPSLNSVVSKYVDQKDNFVTFLSDPQKINPDFPQMPNPQLNENQLKAITTYVVGEYQKRQGVAAR
jgi:cytochrome c